MSILRKCASFISNFKSARSLLFTFHVRAAKALLCENTLKLGGVGTSVTAKIADLSRMFYIRARVGVQNITRECSSYRIECRGIFEHKKQKMAVIPMLRVEAWVLLPNSLKCLARSIVVLEESSSEISNL
jgi:hypothetical protein